MPGLPLWEKLPENHRMVWVGGEAEDSEGREGTGSYRGVGWSSSRKCCSPIEAMPCWSRSQHSPSTALPQGIAPHFCCQPLFESSALTFPKPPEVLGNWRMGENPCSQCSSTENAQVQPNQAQGTSVCERHWYKAKIIVWWLKLM